MFWLTKFASIDDNKDVPQWSCGHCFLYAIFAEIRTIARTYFSGVMCIYTIVFKLYTQPCYIFISKKEIVLVFFYGGILCTLFENANFWLQIKKIFFLVIREPSYGKVVHQLVELFLKHYLRIYLSGRVRMYTYVLCVIKCY